MVNMTVNQKEEIVKKGLKVKLRLRQLVGSERLPIELTILPRVKAILDENAITEVTDSQARMLLGPGHAGEGWELVKDEPTTQVARESEPKVAAKTAKTTAPLPEVSKDFLDKVRG